MKGMYILPLGAAKKEKQLYQELKKQSRGQERQRGKRSKGARLP